MRRSVSRQCNGGERQITTFLGRHVPMFGLKWPDKSRIQHENIVGENRNGKSCLEDVVFTLHLALSSSRTNARAFIKLAESALTRAILHPLDNK